MAGWYYQKDGQNLGPVDIATLKRMAINGELSPSDLIWREGLASWAKLRAAQVEGIFPEQAVLSKPVEFTGTPPTDGGMTVRPPGNHLPAPAMPDAAPQFHKNHMQPTSANPTAKSSHKRVAMAALSFSICGLFAGCCFWWIPMVGFILALIAWNDMLRTEDYKGMGMATLALVLSIFNIGWIGWRIWDLWGHH